MIQPVLQPQEPPKRHILTVSQLNALSKQVLEANVGRVWLSGELSNLTKAASGHWYFSLKDENAQIRCAMFRNKTQHLAFSPKEGDQLVVKGKISLYQARGDYQMIADFMEPAGQGNLQQKLRELMQKLQAEGLFASELKKVIPFLPQRIGVITSPSGAAIHDVLNVLNRRCPMVPVIIYPTQVQSAAAATEIINSLKMAESRDECDVLLLTRGGGSLEDLWCFNDEKLARHIANMHLPVVAAIGHEVDVTLAEMVADLRAPTPSAAAELLVPEQTELQQQIDLQNMALNEAISYFFQQKQTELKFFYLQLANPSNAITTHSQSLNFLARQLNFNMQNYLAKKQQASAQFSTQLNYLNPLEKLNTSRENFALLKRQLGQFYKNNLAYAKNQLQMRAQALENLSPLATLNRGYAILRDEKKQNLLASSKQVKNAQKINIQLKDGELEAKVDSVNHHQGQE